jgi:hypothetical protein
MSRIAEKRWLQDIGRHKIIKKGLFMKEDSQITGKRHK